MSNLPPAGSQVPETLVQVSDTPNFLRWSKAIPSKWARHGLVGVLLVISSFAVWSSITTGRLGEQAIASSVLSDHYSAAATAVLALESLEHKYRLDPGPSILHNFNDSLAQLGTALERVHRSGTPPDHLLVEDVRTSLTPYLESIYKMFDAVDHGDALRARRIDSEEADPLFEKIENAVLQAAAAHHQESIVALEKLRSRESFNASTTPIVFIAGLLLAGLFAEVLRRTRFELDSQRKNALHASLHDKLTGLANRTLLADRFEQAMRLGRRQGSTTGLLLIDLDRFKEVNDTLGHHYGDRLLDLIGKRLINEAREIDTVARLGGDEFAILLPCVEGLEGALKAAQRLHTAITAAFEIDGVELDVEASFGVVVSGLHGDDPSTLLQRADIAMYAAKKQGKCVLAYDPGTDRRSPERLAMLGELRRGLERRELFLEYQPKVSLSTGKVTGVEALVRWQHPVRGLVNPDEFIPFAELTGIIGTLTQYVLNLALSQARAWIDAGLCIPVAVNISARNLLDDKLVVQIIDLLEHYNLTPNMLMLEVTESAIMLDSYAARTILRQLHGMGIHIAIDDFGVGYTSLAQLKDLPISELKIDKSFVLAMQSDQANELIVRSVVDLGHNLGMTVIAEGVETADVLDALGDYHCDMAQGFHVCRPVSAEAFTQWYVQRERK
ncbi:putative bifunctional diguanylate cyclase/phosphodiesterase [Pseudomonas prosekii]|uniref:Diguanylate cyclase (GGDEF) domain-containing protein n=1 Tax=Pseudomonas prosekii TaxID=1148509 RepID=A0A1H1ZFW9_9PSED|nr:EAL domain-containing protein [Pseudomonas prosekii]SDT32519.1 diguanylate cyclase (GGDEF) domain-containing protein [Pseudomonas prosekii]